MNYDDFLLIIKKQKFYVYGAGSMGKRFIKCLENMGDKAKFSWICSYRRKSYI